MKRSNIKIARNLRKNQTDAEKKLWEILRNRQLAGIKFRRQFSINKYILDFYSPEYKLCIEADGGQHYFDNKTDKTRDKYLTDIGIKVLRFNNLEVLDNIEGVCEIIMKSISPHLNPLPIAERK